MANETEQSNKKITDLTTLQTFLTERDNAINTVYISDIPEICKTSPCMLGIDEAGRGPVLGPMVYGTAFCPVDNVELLKSLKCADSKALNEEKRDEIFSNLCKETDKMGWGVEVIAPQSICNSMLSKTKYSLNQVSMDSAINLIKKVQEAGVNISHVYVDTVGPPEKYQAYLKTVFPDFKITVAKKADSTYPIVSAASICAKVSRDHALKVWKFPEGLEDVNYEQFGSGYPGDPNTKKFLVDHCDPVFGYPQLVRFSWSTASEALKEAYHVEWDDTEDTVETPKNNSSITSFFKMTPSKGVNKRKEHEFFTDRNLTRKVDF